VNLLKNNNVVNLNICEGCGKNLKDDWKVCPYCTTPVKITKCNHCGFDVSYNWNFCPYCTNEIIAENNNKIRIEKCNDWLRDILK
jgi:RNA polymerase subunit RPABC4/transcription elongation factor Spt4